MEKERKKLHISELCPCFLNVGPMAHSALSLSEHCIGTMVPGKGMWEQVGEKGLVREEPVIRVQHGLGGQWLPTSCGRCREEE